MLTYRSRLESPMKIAMAASRAVTCAIKVLAHHDTRTIPDCSAPYAYKKHEAECRGILRTAILNYELTN